MIMASHKICLFALFCVSALGLVHCCDPVPSVRSSPTHFENTPFDNCITAFGPGSTTTTATITCSTTHSGTATTSSSTTSCTCTSTSVGAITGTASCTSSTTLSTTPTTSSGTSSSTCTTTGTSRTPRGLPQLGSWTYTDSATNVTCVAVQFAATLNVDYFTNGANGTQLGHSMLNIPSEAEVTSGHCGDSEQWITLEWPSDPVDITHGVHANNSLKLQWVAGPSSYHLAALDATIVLDQNFPDATRDVLRLSHSSSEWEATDGAPYRREEASLDLADIDGAAAVLTFSRLHQEAFLTESRTDYFTDVKGEQQVDVVRADIV